MVNVLGIDYGSKRIGLAVGSLEARLARPLKIVTNSKNLDRELEAICQAEQIEQIVIGLPRNLRGVETAQSATVRDFGHRLAERLKLPVKYQDETLTSVVAAQRLSIAALPKRPAVDAAAAAIILQDYLDRQ